MLAKIVLSAVAAGTITISTFLAPGVAQAAFKAVCDHPNGGACTAIRSSGHIACTCGGEDHETTNEDIKNASDDALMDACWDAYSLFCTERADEVATCEEPDLGSCDVSGGDGGTADCKCDAIGTVNRDNIAELEDLTGEALEDECLEQLDRICVPPPAAAMAPIPATNASFGDPGGGSTMSCTTTGGAPAPLSLLLLIPIGALARRRRG